MAFSLLSGKQLFLIIATSIALIFVAYGLFFRSRGRYLQQAALLLILAGGIGNLIDRVLNGEVVDYINLLFMQFAVFNFADICVCVGVGLWVLVIFLEELHQRSRIANRFCRPIPDPVRYNSEPSALPAGADYSSADNRTGPQKSGKTH